jgi:hypothetical protein
MRLPYLKACVSVGAWSMENGKESNVTNCIGQKQAKTLGIKGSIRFCDNVSRWVQPPDAENHMSGGVAEVAGAIPSPRADQGYCETATGAEARKPYRGRSR